MIEAREIVVRCARHLFRYNLLANIGQWGNVQNGRGLVTLIYRDIGRVRHGQRQE